jgi:hypothetical protein
MYGGEGGIRTPDSLATMSDFESGAFNRALPPLRCWKNLGPRSSKNSHDLSAHQQFTGPGAPRQYRLAFLRLAHLHPRSRLFHRFLCARASTASEPPPYRSNFRPELRLAVRRCPVSRYPFDVRK